MQYFKFVIKKIGLIYSLRQGLHPAFVQIRRWIDDFSLSSFPILSLFSFFLPFYLFSVFSQNNKVKYHILKILSQILCVLLPTNQLNLNKQ